MLGPYDGTLTAGSLDRLGNQHTPVRPVGGRATLAKLNGWAMVMIIEGYLRGM